MPAWQTCWRAGGGGAASRRFWCDTLSVSECDVPSARRGVLSRPGRWLAIVVATSVLLAGCAVRTGVEPLTDVQRTLVRSQIFDTQWAQVSAQYPEALRPDVRVVRTVPDADWVGLVANCLSRAGFTVRSGTGRLEYSGSQGQTPIEYAVSSFACFSEYPTVGQASHHLSASVIGALYDYYREFVRPCLLAAGQSSPPPPSRARFVLAGRAGESSWNPYERVTVEVLSEQESRYLELRCPPVPQWLNLAER